MLLFYYLGMNIITTDNSLAWTISDNTSGSGKLKRAGKPKAASATQDVLTSSITKYLGDSAKFENNNTNRQLALQEEKLKLEQRKMDLMEKQQKFAEQQYDRRGYGNYYGKPGPDLQQYHFRGHGNYYGRPGMHVVLK